ncbi:MAG: hypothetical protein H5T85_00845 [Actinobacteria bacterium]|nr:hypothetical protein [Actinomycetota bacterium]
MYKCSNCGNSEKFIGYAEEKGEALIYQNTLANSIGEKIPETPQKSYSWIYIISGKSWKGNVTIKKCYYCSSTKIIKC